MEVLINMLVTHLCPAPSQGSGFYEDDMMYVYLLGVLFPSQRGGESEYKLEDEGDDFGISMVGEASPNVVNEDTSRKNSILERLFGRSAFDSGSPSGNDDEDVSEVDETSSDSLGGKSQNNVNHIEL